MTIGNNEPAPVNERAPLANDTHTIAPTKPIKPTINTTDHSGLLCGGGTFSGVGRSIVCGLNDGASAVSLRANPCFTISEPPIAPGWRRRAMCCGVPAHQ